VIVISHARGGSNYLCRAVAQYTSSINLNEFFNIGSPLLWGNIVLQRRNIIDGKPNVIHTLVIKDNLSLKETQVQQILDDTTIVVDSQIQIDQFIKAETARRLAYLDQLTAANKQYVFKHFLSYPNAELDNKLFALPNKILLYRKDFKETILSNLIKRLHYDVRPTDHGMLGNASVEVGHNMDNMPAPMVTPIAIAPATIKDSVNAIFQLFVNYEKYAPIESISYEDMFAGASVTVDKVSISPLTITQQYIIKPERKMDYSLTGNKIDFFIDPDNVSTLISDTATTHASALGIDDVIKQLGVHW